MKFVRNLKELKSRLKFIIFNLGWVFSGLELAKLQILEL
jgi:hypothetical protein